MQHEIIFQCGSGDRLQRTNTGGMTTAGSRGDRRKSCMDRSYTLEPDPAFLRKLEALPGQPFSNAQAGARDDMLRRHFFDLTLAFLHPFALCLNVDTSVDHAAVSPLLDGIERASPAGFDEMVFMDTFQPVGIFAALPRGRCRDLYERFIRGANFQPWFAQQLERIAPRQGHQVTFVTPTTHVPAVDSPTTDGHDMETLPPLQPGSSPGSLDFAGGDDCNVGMGSERDLGYHDNDVLNTS